MSFFHKIQTTIGIIKLFKNWELFLLCYFRVIKNKDTVFKFRNGLIWHADTTENGFPVISDVWIQNPYHYLFKLKDPKVIVDLGGHIGSFSILAATRFPDATIYSVEASKENYAFLVKNIKANKIKNIVPLNIGVGDSNCTLDFYVNKESSFLNSFVKNRQKNNKYSYKVKCKTLAKLFSELKIKHCDFLKVDIEGMEYPVLHAADRDGVLPHVGMVVSEVNTWSEDFKKTVDLLSKNKFKVHIADDIISAEKK